MKKRILWAIICWLPSLAFSQKSNDSAEFEVFFKEFVTALQKGDMKKVADFMEFPFNSADISYPIRQKAMSQKDSTVEDITREVFLKYYAAAIQKKHIKMLSKSPHTRTELYGDECICYAVVYHRGENSAAWYVFAKSGKGWRWIMTDNVSM